ncbi:MAG: hypothetical protein CK430_15085 [Legionella sp.]|nr:MAG: hypothetical protein CK430_15085 [Legionella sp.]
MILLNYQPPIEAKRRGQGYQLFDEKKDGCTKILLKENKMDIFEYLKKDHDKVSALFKHFKSAPDKRKADIAKLTLT